MPTIDISLATRVQRSARVMQLEGLFGLPAADHSTFALSVDLPLDERDWSIGLVVGPSGSGKSTVMREIGLRLEAGCLRRTQESTPVPVTATSKSAHSLKSQATNFVAPPFAWPSDRAVIDGFPAELGIKEIASLLSSVGFSSPPAWLRPYRVLSAGQQFRATLARAIAEAEARLRSASSGADLSCPTEQGAGILANEDRRDNPVGSAEAGWDKGGASFSSRLTSEASVLILIDEFSSVVDRMTARIGSHAAARAVRLRGLHLIAASCHYDVIDWMQPDWTFEPHTGSFSWRRLWRRPPLSVAIARAPSATWELFRRHHYLDTGLSPAARCFVGRFDGQPAAFVAVLSFPHPIRPGWREHRVVCLPDYQGVGLGHAVAEFVASLFRSSGRPYRSVTSHPAMIAHRARSPLWRMTRPPSRLRANRLRRFVSTSSRDRLTASFEYVGPARPAEALAFGIVATPDASQSLEVGGAAVHVSGMRGIAN